MAPVWHHNDTPDWTSLLCTVPKFLKFPRIKMHTGITSSQSSHLSSWNTAIESTGVADYDYWMGQRASCLNLQQPDGKPPSLTRNIQTFVTRASREIVRRLWTRQECLYSANVSIVLLEPNYEIYLSSASARLWNTRSVFFSCARHLQLQVCRFWVVLSSYRSRLSVVGLLVLLGNWRRINRPHFGFPTLQKTSWRETCLLGSCWQFKRVQ